MATQPLTPATVSLRVPVGDGKREVVTLPPEGIDPALLLANKHSPIDAAAYQSVADQVHAGKEWESKRVFVTSPAPGDGKTCTAFNLAWTLSVGGASVLLVELNFLRPRFRSALGGLQIRFGIDCALRGLADRADSIFSLGNESLSVAAVKNPMRKGELKQRLPRLASYLNWAGENYDWLVLDCPPVLSSAWNHWFHDYARPALLVIREQHTPAIQVRQTISRMRYRIKGILLNDSGNVAASGRKVTQSDKCLREVGSPNEFK